MSVVHIRNSEKSGVSSSRPVVSTSVSAAPIHSISGLNVISSGWQSDTQTIEFANDYKIYFNVSISYEVDADSAVWDGSQMVMYIDGVADTDQVATGVGVNHYHGTMTVTGCASVTAGTHEFYVRFVDGETGNDDEPISNFSGFILVCAESFSVSAASVYYAYVNTSNTQVDAAINNDSSLYFSCDSTGYYKFDYPTVTSFEISNPYGSGVLWRSASSAPVALACHPTNGNVYSVESDGTFRGLSASASSGSGFTLIDGLSVLGGPMNWIPHLNGFVQTGTEASPGMRLLQPSGLSSVTVTDLGVNAAGPVVSTSDDTLWYRAVEAVGEVYLESLNGTVTTRYERMLRGPIPGRYSDGVYYQSYPSFADRFAPPEGDSDATDGYFPRIVTFTSDWTNVIFTFGGGDEIVELNESTDSTIVTQGSGGGGE